MKKSDLKAGMVVEIRRGERSLVVGDLIIDNDSWNRLNNYDDDLKNNTFEEHDIVKVYKPEECYKLRPSKFNELNNDDLIWERKDDDTKKDIDGLLEKYDRKELEKVIGLLQSANMKR